MFLVALAVENSKKPLVLVSYRNQVFLDFHFSLTSKSKKEKNKKNKNSTHFSLIWHEVQKWSIKQFLYGHVWKIGTPFGTLVRPVEKLASRLASWHTKLNHWHAVWHIGTFIGKLATLWINVFMTLTVFKRKQEMLHILKIAVR